MRRPPAAVRPPPEDEARRGVLVQVRPRQFARAVAQQSILTVSPDIGVGRPASWWMRGKLATRIRLQEKWKPEMQAACQSMRLSRVGLFRDLDSLGGSIGRDFMNRVRESDLYSEDVLYQGGYRASAATSHRHAARLTSKASANRAPIIFLLGPGLMQAAGEHR